MLDRLNIKLLIPNVVVGFAFVFAVIFFGDALSHGAMIGLMAAMIAVQSLASYVYSEKQLTARLDKLKHYLDDVVNVNKAPQGALNDITDDNLGKIINQLSKFITNLSDVISEIRSESELLRDGSTHLATQMEESVNAVDESTHQIELMANSIEQVAQMSVDLSNSAEQVSETTSRVMEILAQGTASSSTSQKIIVSVADKVNGTANDLALLQEECSRIGSVLDVIRGIAEQTNLLALNAAIEAARAGEQGRGFAVVADEVRALAHRTQESTVEIQSMVEGLQTKSNNAVNAISRGQELTKDSLSHSQEVVKALEQVGDVFAEVDNLTSQIASGTNEQRNSTSSINNNMAAVLTLSREITSGLASVAKHAEQQRTTTAAVDVTLSRVCV